MSDNLEWDPAEWRATESGVVICAEESSRRNPVGVWPLMPAELRMVSELLAV